MALLQQFGGLLFVNFCDRRDNANASSLELDIGSSEINHPISVCLAEQYHGGGCQHIQYHLGGSSSFQASRTADDFGANDRGDNHICYALQLRLPIARDTDCISAESFCVPQSAHDIRCTTTAGDTHQDIVLVQFMLREIGDGGLLVIFSPLDGGG